MVVRINFDGACGKLGKMDLISIGVAGYIDGKPAPELSSSEFIGYGTNNMAEWEALKKALELLQEFQKKQVSVFSVSILGDSQLIVNQFNKKWEVRQPHLMGYYKECRELYDKLPQVLKKQVSIRWVPREKNTDADKLSKDSMKLYLKDNVDNLQKI